LNEYWIFETENWTENIERLIKGGLAKIRDKFSDYVYPQLKKEPHYGMNIKKLKDWQPKTWRYRIGDYRFFYEIDEEEKVVYLIAAYHRKEAYRMKNKLLPKLIDYL